MDINETVNLHDEKLRQHADETKRLSQRLAQQDERLSQRLAQHDERLAQYENATHRLKLCRVQHPRLAWPVEEDTLPIVRSEHPTNFHQGMSHLGVCVCLVHIKHAWWVCNVLVKQEPVGSVEWDGKVQEQHVSRCVCVCRVQILTTFLLFVSSYYIYLLCFECIYKHSRQIPVGQYVPHLHAAHCSGRPIARHHMATMRRHLELPWPYGLRAPQSYW